MRLLKRTLYNVHPNYTRSYTLTTHNTTQYIVVLTVTTSHCLFTQASVLRCAKEEDLKDARNVTARRTFRVRKANKPKPKKDTGASQNSVNTAGANANGKLSKDLIGLSL